jgi:hypothetical protein
MVDGKAAGMIPDLKSGQLWVEKQIRELACKLGWPVDCLQ